MRITLLAISVTLLAPLSLLAQSISETKSQTDARERIETQRKLASSPKIGAVSETARYHRVICIMKLVGKGTPEDPVRPEYAPRETDTPDRNGILAWNMQLSDDRKFALVQYVAANKQALDAIFQDKRPDIKVFEIGRETKKNVENELRKIKKDFDLESLQVVAR